MKKVIFLFSLILLVSISHAQVQTSDEPVKKPAPYSAARMTSGGLLFISGQIPIEPETGRVMKGNIEMETRLVMKRLEKILKDYEMDFSDLVKCTVFLTDIRDYGIVNKAYSDFFSEEFPAREAIEVANLPLGASIEISGIASK